jgi:hypothetical protein
MLPFHQAGGASCSGGSSPSITACWPPQERKRSEEAQRAAAAQQGRAADAEGRAERAAAEARQLAAELEQRQELVAALQAGAHTFRQLRHLWQPAWLAAAGLLTVPCVASCPPPPPLPPLPLPTFPHALPPFVCERVYFAG